MNLEKEIEKRRKEIFTDQLSMSVGELEGLYDRGEIDLHPKFQRVLRWIPEQKTRLIESILLRIPVPPIFVAQDKEGRWDIVDGMQRLGTIFEFLGILKDQDGQKRPALVLTETHLLPSLEGITFTGPKATSFSKSMQLDFRRARLDIKIVQKESDPASKYELFERLNTGGSIASAQEVRNCVLVWMNEKRFDWMKNLASDENFTECVPISDRLEDQGYRTELLLRFISLRTFDSEKIPKIADLGTFLNDQNRALAATKGFNSDKEEEAFRETFRFLNVAYGSDSLRKFDKKKGRFVGPFLLSVFEAAALGVAFNLSKWQKATDFEKKLRSRLEKIWDEKEFTGSVGPGISARDRMKHTIPFGRTFFVP